MLGFARDDNRSLVIRQKFLDILGVRNREAAIQSLAAFLFAAFARVKMILAAAAFDNLSLLVYLESFGD
jgi:hypothetical protein